MDFSRIYVFLSLPSLTQPSDFHSVKVISSHRMLYVLTPNLNGMIFLTLESRGVQNFLISSIRFLDVLFLHLKSSLSSLKVRKNSPFLRKLKKNYEKSNLNEFGNTFDYFKSLGIWTNRNDAFDLMWGK